MPITLSLPQLVTVILLTAIVGCTLGMGLLSMLVIGRQSDHDEMGVRLSQSDNDEPTAKFMEPQASVVQQEPLGFVSPKQVERIVDPDGEFGAYIPMRKTPAGNFTLAVYTNPAQQAKPQPMDAIKAAFMAGFEAVECYAVLNTRDEAWEDYARSKTKESEQ